MTMNPETEENQEKYDEWIEKKSKLLEEAENYQHELEDVKLKLKDTKKHIALSELEDDDRFQRLLPGRKRLMDTIRMIAYRAETAMVGLITGPDMDSSDARQVLQDLFITEADILPDSTNNELRIRAICTHSPRSEAERDLRQRPRSVAERDLPICANRDQTSALACRSGW